MKQYWTLNDMATHSSPTTVPTNTGDKGTFEYPKNLPEDAPLQAAYLYRMVRETLDNSQRTQEAIYDLDQQVGALKRRGEDVNGQLMAICSLQENQQIGLREIHKALLPPLGKGKAKAEPSPGPSRPTEAKKEPSRMTRCTSFTYSIGSPSSSRSSSPVRAGFSFRASVCHDLTFTFIHSHRLLPLYQHITSIP
jgi:hypothetical protein